MILTRFKGGHVKCVDPQPAQSVDVAFLSEPAVQDYLEGTAAYSAFKDGRCVACAGILAFDAHTAIVWALLSKHIGSSIIPVTRRCQALMRMFPAARFETAVMTGFPEGERWVQILGFKPGPSKAGLDVSYAELGVEAVTYVRHK